MEIVLKTILCYGDSNTWGLDPKTQDRFSRSIRWTGRLQTVLGNNYYVIEEGLCGRTTVWDDPIEEFRNGKDYLIPCLLSHKPIDLVVLMLGTNDLKMRFSIPVIDVALGIKKLIEIIQNSEVNPENGPPKILLLSPPCINRMNKTGEEIFEGASEKSKMLSKYYYELSVDYGCVFFDISTIVSPSKDEGLHLDEKSHICIADKLATIIKEMIFVHKEIKPDNL